MKFTTHINYFLFFILVVLVVLLAVSAYLLWFEFPRGYHGDRATWIDIHKWLGFGLFVAVVLHVLLHIRWLWRMTRYYVRWIIRLSGTDTKIKSIDTQKGDS
ncbi:MAG: DUF4405 domain-containing protein [Chloroflexi bacterium]|nr:DUF4405 domain-containing protein [Chloroflexota bacterium]